MARTTINTPAGPAASLARKKTGKTKVKVWPELVLRESLAMVLSSLVLVVLSLLLDAPLESLADPSFSTNPSKAPWYFLGLQELLVYFSPWVAGVLIPLLLLGALAAIPYLDHHLHNITEPVRTRALRVAFSTGLLLWICLTIVGLFFRGPNWAWIWPWS